MAKLNAAKKILSSHLVSGDMVPGKEISIKIDQTLTQDATGTMAYLQLEAIGIDRVRTTAVSYVDHNTLQNDFKNADDHVYLQSVAARYGVNFSRPGNGICHQVHLERFTVPGQTLLGSDSHTPTAGGAGMIAMGAGGLDVAVAMAGGPFHLLMPEIIGIRLKGKLGRWAAPRDIILEVLRILTVKGGVGKIMEYCGEGVKNIPLPGRATITNMGAELGATTSLFPSDDVTRKFFQAQGRLNKWKRLEADGGAGYDRMIEIDLGKLEPLIARPHSPDNVSRVSQMEGIPVQQVCIGSCTNSSYSDLMTVAAMLKNKSVHPGVSLTISPGSRQVFTMIANNGALAEMIRAGARMLESACGPCIGMGQAPSSGAVTIRSFNRNFEGRSGTADAQVYLASPEVCAAAAITGKITSPARLGRPPAIKVPGKFATDDSGILVPSPLKKALKVAVIRGPNIKPLPEFKPLPADISGPVLLKVGDNITTDHILPAGSKVLPLRSNIPAIAEHTYTRVDPEFPARAKKTGAPFFITGGENYGQGSSREHAAIAPYYLGLRVVVAKSFARIHYANLVNFGIVPLTFANPADYDSIAQGDSLEIKNIGAALKAGSELTIRNATKNSDFKVKHAFTGRQIEILEAGGLLNFTRRQTAGHR